MIHDQQIDWIGLVFGVVVRILAAVAVVVEEAKGVTGQAKQLQGMWDEAVVVGDQGWPWWAVVVATHSAPMVAVVHPAPTVVVVVHSALRADELVYNSPSQATPPNSHMGPAPTETC